VTKEHISLQTDRILSVYNTRTRTTQSGGAAVLIRDVIRDREPPSMKATPSVMEAAQLHGRQEKRRRLRAGS